MNNFSSDLCTLSILTESTLLCSIEQRCRNQLTESYIGGVLLSLGPSSASIGPQFLPSFSSSVLRSLAFTQEDQSIIVSGYYGTGKKKLARDCLSALLAHLEPQQTQSLNLSILLVSDLLDLLTNSDEDESSGAVLITSLLVSPTNLVLTGATVSCLLLDTSSVLHLKVFSQRDGLKLVESCLNKLGMKAELVQEVGLVLGVISDLLVAKQNAAQALGILGVSKMCGTLPSENSLLQLLYPYVVQWIVQWVNASCLGATANHPEGCLVSVVCAPGHSFVDRQPRENSGLPALITRYTNEVLHNIYCNRLFVWEQEQYMEEGIAWDTVEVDFNESLINCFHQEENGLFHALGLSNQEDRRAEIERCCCQSGDSCFMLESDKDRFSVVHFTGEHEYCMDEEWTKMDQMQVASPTLQGALLSSSFDVVVNMAQNMKHSSDVLPQFQEIACCKLTQRAKRAMDSVCELLITSQPHFVFCFKPSKNGLRSFNCEYVLSQIQQFKILDIALIQSCGFPVRLTHSNFLKNYSVLCVNSNAELLSDKEKCVVILDVSHLKEWHVGQTKVMLKPWHLRQLDTALDLFNQSAKKLQRAFKQSISRKRQSLPTPNFPPSPPPRPSHTLPASEEASRGDEYDRAKSSSPTSTRKKLSWKKPSPLGKSGEPTSRSVNSSSTLQGFLWFQGKLSREKAENLLQEVQFDCFLVRESENRIGEYALSIRHSGIIKHFRIDSKHGLNQRYELYGAKRSFASLEILVDYYSHHCISSGGELLAVPYSTEKPKGTVGLKRKLSSIRRPKPSLVAMPVTASRLPRVETTPALVGSNDTHKSSPRKGVSLDISDDSIAIIQRELEVEERIVQAARRMAELPTSNRRERQKRKQSLQQAQSRFLSLKQQFHTLQERKFFIEASMKNT